MLSRFICEVLSRVKLSTVNVIFESVAAVATGEFDRKKILKSMAKELPAIAVPKEFYIIEDIPIMGSGKVAFREVERICRERQENGNKWN